MTGRKKLLLIFFIVSLVLYAPITFYSAQNYQQSAHITNATLNRSDMSHRVEISPTHNVPQDIDSIFVDMVPYCKHFAHKTRAISTRPMRVINSLKWLPTHVEVLYHKTYENESISAQGIDIPIAAHGTTLKIMPGVVFYHPEHVISDRFGNIYKFNHYNVESVLPSTRFNCSAIHYHHGKLMIFIRPWAYVFSHVVATVLPALQFTCSFLIDHENIYILVVSAIQQELMCEVCSAVCNISRILFYHKIGWRNPVIADELYYPFFWNTQTDWPLGMYPANTLTPLPWTPPKTSLRYISQDAFIRTIPGPENLRLGDNDSSNRRDLIYMPRPPHTRRHVQNETVMLRQICTLLGHVPSIQLRVFRSSGSYKQDRKHLNKAIVLLSPHSGAMANMLFVPRDCSVVEFVDLETGNPYYIGLSRVLGLNHITVKPSLFDHYNDSIPLIVDFTSVLNSLRNIEYVMARFINVSNISHVDDCVSIVDKEFS